MKTAAVIASCDTKCAEVQFLCSRLQEAGITPLVIDISVGLGESAGWADIGREQVFAASGLVWQEIRDRPKGELVRLMQEAVKITVRDLHERSKIDGIIAIGGVQ
ncbi:MAG: Tm-1-like ATP-binding domain-containing protein, partial [Treponema sp.]|nr:Tm-1-like ATP-binding domain-containing protein [Treponema sp.]